MVILALLNLIFVTIQSYICKGNKPIADQVIIKLHLPSLRLSMKRCVPLITLLFAFSQPSLLFAQKNFRVGFVVFGSQDTLRGFINSRNWNRNPVSVEFKKSLESEEKTYTINEISAFKVDDEAYVKAKVMVDTSPVNLNSLSSSPTPAMEPQTVLLRILVQGPKSLYCLVTRDVKKLFFIARGQSYEPLINYFYIKPGENMGIIEVEDYKEQLQNYLDDCLSLTSTISALKYDGDVMTALFEKYYRCTDTKPAFKAKSEQLSLKMGILGGFTMSRVNLEDWGLGYPKKTNFQPSSIPSIGAHFNVVFPRTRKNYR